MTYKLYVKTLQKIEKVNILKRLLKQIEDDDNISLRQYEALRYVIIKKIYGF